MLADLRDAFRGFTRNPGFVVAAVLSIALGVGANTAIFSVASALLLRPLPYQDPDRLTILWSRSPGLGIAEDWFSTAQYFDIKTAGASFDEVAIAIGGNDNLTGDGDPERIGTLRVSSNLLPMLGARAAAGRLFVAADEVPGAAGAALLGHGTWMRRYGGDPLVIGKPIALNGQPYRIVGVLPASFSLRREVMPTLGGAADAEIVVPLPLGPEAPNTRNREDYNILARLKAGRSVQQARAEMDTITARLRRDYPAFYPPNGGLTFDVLPLHEQVVGNVRQSLIVLVGAVGFVLLIACANVANLLLSRALGRQKEIAVRAALGASRVRIVRQLLTESVLLGLLGGGVGLLLAFWSLKWIQVLGSQSVPRLHEIAIDGRVLLFTLALSLMSAVLFGLVPALRLGALDINENLKDGARGSGGTGALWGRGQRTRRALVVAELAMSVMLLTAAGLLVRSFAQLQRIPPGFSADNVLTLELTMNGRKYTDVQHVLDTYRDLWARLGKLPGVTAAGAVSALPLSQMMAWGPVTVEGRTPPAGESFINADQRTVAADYFRALEIPLRRGRLFDEHDTRTNPRVVVVDEHMAQQLWPDQDPIGRRIRTGGIDASDSAPWMTVVGVVGRIKQDTLDSESRMAFYRPHTQSPGRAMNVVLRSRIAPERLTAAVRKEIREVDPDLPIYGVRTMTGRVDESLARRRFSMLLLTIFATLASGLAAIGIYGVVAYFVNQGTRELGIRMALGATPRGIRVLVVRHGVAVAVAGVALGLAGALAVGRFMRSLLFGINANDPVTFGSIAILLGMVAIVASYLPARRAARIDPMLALRHD
jgi:predicted permease